MPHGDFLIAPSILSADFARLGEEVETVLAAGADMIHFDVMDNHYVPNLTIGPVVCEALRKHGIKAPIDVHLMVKPVDRIVPDFAKAGANYITFHPEASEHVDRTLALIHDNGCKAGLVFNPATPLDYLELRDGQGGHGAHHVRQPGFGGQSFIRSSLDKLKQARELIDTERPRHPPGDRRRGEGGQYPRDRRRGRRHLRGGLRHLRREGLQGRHQGDARRTCARRALRVPIQLVAFDLDGTLVDSAPDIAYAVGAMTRELGLPSPGVEKVRQWVGDGARRLVKRVLTGEADGEPEAALYQRGFRAFRRAYRSHLAVETRLYPGAMEVLEFLRERDCAMACVTNKAAEFTEPLLEALAIREYFGVVLSGDSLMQRETRPAAATAYRAVFQYRPGTGLHDRGFAQ